MFLEHMLPHHTGAIQMVHNALPNLKETNLKTMAGIRTFVSTLAAT